MSDPNVTPTRPMHETSDMEPHYVLYFGVTIIVLGVLICGGVWWMFRRLERQAPTGVTPKVEVTIPPPTPPLQISPETDLIDMRRKEDQVLSSYGWVNRSEGTARIPIERAMQLVLERQKK